MARRRRGKDPKSESRMGFLLGAAGILILLVLFSGYAWVKSNKIQLDAENCPTSGPRGIHVLLFDRSDPISEQQAQRVRQYIDKVKLTATFGTRFDLYTFEGDTLHALEPKLRICAPGKPEEANIWIDNPERVRKKYDNDFSKVLDQTVAELLRASTQPNSPIIESIKAATITSFGPTERGRIPLHVTMISDMVQHTKLLSQFQSDVKFADLAQNPTWLSLQPQFKGAEVDIVYLLRPTAQRNHLPIQSRSHQLFWEQLISAAGGRLNTVDPI
jgi:hypothetical protein